MFYVAMPTKMVEKCFYVYSVWKFYEKCKKNVISTCFQKQGFPLALIFQHLIEFLVETQ